MEINNTPYQNQTSKIKWAFVSILVVGIALASGWFFLGPKVTGSVLGASTSYQAVFLTNGQVYFGKLEIKGDWVELTDIYYLQATQNLQQADSEANKQSNVQLVKLGSELHGPTDAMHIDRDKILFWEDLKDDSKVVQAINQHKGK